MLGFFLNFFTPWKSCVKGHWPKKLLFPKKLAWLCDLALKAKKRVKYIWVPETMIDDCIQYGHTNINVSSVLCTNQELNQYYNWSNGSNQSCTFETDYTLKYHLYAICWHKQSPDNQTIQFWHQVSGQFRKPDQQVLFGRSLRVVRIIYFRWEVFPSRESTLGLTGLTFS